MTASITCPKCKATSYNPNDVEQGYCARCHDWTSGANPWPPVRGERRDCPDCEQGKHANCDNTSWDNATDSLVACPCDQRGHTP